MTKNTASRGAGKGEEHFAQMLAQEPFDGLKAILDKLSPSQGELWQRVQSATSFEELLGRLGYKLTLTRQIHVQDCYSRVGPAGGIRAVIPHYEIATQSSFPTLINFDGTVTATEKSAVYFNKLLLQLQEQLAGVKGGKVPA
jgi:hypothetical protein